MDEYERLEAELTTQYAMYVQAWRNLSYLEAELDAINTQEEDRIAENDRQLQMMQRRLREEELRSEPSPHPHSPHPVLALAPYRALVPQTAHSHSPAIPPHAACHQSFVVKPRWMSRRSTTRSWWETTARGSNGRGQRGAAAPVVAVAASSPAGSLVACTAR